MARKETNPVPDDENDESFHDDMCISEETNDYVHCDMGRDAVRRALIRQHFTNYS